MSDGQVGALVGRPGGARVLGPLAVLSGTLLSMVSVAVWRRNVGNASCRWRVSYEPDDNAFGIWVIIYGWSIFLLSVQVTGQLPIVSWATSLLWAASWTAAAVWPPLFDADSPAALRAAAVMISTAATFATGAAWASSQWVADSAESLALQTLVGAPLSLLAGWLLTAASLGVGIAAKASADDAERTCVEPRRLGESRDAYRRRRAVVAADAVAQGKPSVVPLVLAVSAAALAVCATDPILPIPLVWAQANSRSFTAVPVAAMCVGAFGSACALLRALL